MDESPNDLRVACPGKSRFTLQTLPAEARRSTFNVDYRVTQLRGARSGSR